MEYLKFLDFTDNSGKFDRDYRCLEIELEIVSCSIRLQNSIFHVSEQSHLTVCVAVWCVAYSNVTLMALAFVIVPFVYAITRFIAEDIKRSSLNLKNRMLTEI